MHFNFLETETRKIVWNVSECWQFLVSYGLLLFWSYILDKTYRFGNFVQSKQFCQFYFFTIWVYNMFVRKFVWHTLELKIFKFMVQNSVNFKIIFLNFRYTSSISYLIKSLTKIIIQHHFNLIWHFLRLPH